MCNKYDRQLRYWKRYWSRYNISKFIINETRSIARKYGTEKWFNIVIIPCIMKMWESHEMIWYNVCHMCDMKGLI